MVTGTDSIDDLDVLRHGGMAALFGASRSFLVELARVKPLLPGAAAATYVDVDLSFPS